MIERRINILLIEDNPGDARLIQEDLRDVKNFNHSIQIAPSLKKGLEFLNQNQYDVILLDLSLPDSVGLDSLSKLKKFIHNTPIIVLTGLDSEEVAFSAVKAGAQDYLIKGQSNGDLLARAIQYGIERNELYRDLAHERDLIAITLKNIHDGVLRTDIDGNITLINESVKKIFGDITGKTIIDFFNEDLVLPNEILSKSIKSLYSNQMDCGLFNFKANKTLIKPLKDQYKTLSLSVNQENSNENSLNGYIFLIRDITEQIKLQNELLKSQKIDSIGILAAGIAHDFNNFLQTVMGNIFIAKSKCEDSELSRFLEDAEKSVVDARSLTQQLLSFSKEDTPFIKKTKDISTILKSFVEFAVRGTNTVVEYDIQDDLWLLDIDEGQFSQLINNLVINSVQAMPDGGNLCVSAKNRSIQNEISIPSIEGKYVEITLEDTGCGIPEEHIKKVFEPYFTTKPKGNGLGLTMCFSIMKKHDGYIQIDSYPQEGTKISLYFPKSQANSVESDEVSETLLSKSGKILIMDDDEKIQEILSLMLENLGFEVECTSNGKSLLEIYQNSINNDNKFDLLIIDLINKGGMGGKTVIDELKKIDPEVNAIISSGYVTNPIMENYAEYGFNGRLPKPYQIKSLKSLLNNVLIK